LLLHAFQLTSALAVAEGLVQHHITCWHAQLDKYTYPPTLGLPALPRRLVYYTGFNLWMPTFITNGQTTMLVALMAGSDGVTTVPFTTSLTTFTGNPLTPGPAGGGRRLLAATPGATFTFPTTANTPLLLNSRAPPLRTGDYTAVAIAPDGRLWGSGMVVADAAAAGNWGNVVFRLAANQ
jgi:hypothetical protein